MTHSDGATTGSRGRYRANTLLKRLVAMGWFETAELARELVVSEKALSAFLDEDAPMPLDRQLCLALLLIENVPPLARQGHRLRGQIKAAVAFNEHTTAVHMSPPAITRWQ
jgi:hypothetical protein